MKGKFLGLVTALAIAAPSLSAIESSKGTLDVAKAKTEVEFLAIGNPSALKIRGRAKEEGQKPATGTLTIDNGSITGKVGVLVDSFDTGIALRNKHMKEKYLEVGKFPSSELALTELKLPAPGDVSVKAVPFKGNLTLHGVTKPVAGVADVEKHGKDVALKFEFKVGTDDYNISTPSFMGITVTREVTVNANIEGSVN